MTVFSLTNLSTRTSYEYAVDALSIQPNTSTAVTGLADVVPEVMYFTAVETVTVDQCSINLVERSASEAGSCEHENIYEDSLCDYMTNDELHEYDYCVEIDNIAQNCAKACLC